MSLDDLEEIVVTYFPSIGDDRNIAKQIIFRIVSNQSQDNQSLEDDRNELRKNEAIVVDPQKTKKNAIYNKSKNENQRVVDDDQSILSYETHETPESNDSDIDQEEEGDDDDTILHHENLRMSIPTELSLVDVTELHDAFPNISILSLQYLFHVQCYDNIAETCQYLLDHSSGITK